VLSLKLIDGTPGVPVTVTDSASVPGRCATPRSTVAPSSIGLDPVGGAYVTTTLHVCPAASVVPHAPALARLKSVAPVIVGFSVIAAFPVFFTTATVCVTDVPTSVTPNCCEPPLRLTFVVDVPQPHSDSRRKAGRKRQRFTGVLQI
jgi:hypothetical protein